MRKQAAGGALAILYHTKVGLLMTASMAKYMLVEKNNQQPNPDDIDFALTPRVETFSEGKWYTNLYDLKAKVNHSDANAIIKFDVQAQLVNENREGLDETRRAQHKVNGRGFARFVSRYPAFSLCRDFK